MAKLDLNIFSFDSRLDFQSGYVRQEMFFQSSWTLRDVLQNIHAKSFGYQEFGVDLDFIHCRINGFAIFGNIAVYELIDKFGTTWVIDPLSKKFAQKDLLLNLDKAFAQYNTFFRMAHFITPSDREELKKYLPINFIATCYDDEYCGDGFILYIKWLLSRYPLYKKQLLSTLCTFENGIFEHICIANFLFPANNTIDLAIESLQSDLVNGAKTLVPKMCFEFGKYLDGQYRFSCHSAMVHENKIPIQSNFVQKIVDSNI
ncbi:hypothetical protein CQA53_06735 [Helicobacter didelphidarum]|uniref:DUF5644 domain-containing protein n=1 Tax=Helicobacter didelphidarum TaxID=2040648 RepID=A0A3D8IK17_9HELI|nr:DUF5644 domain-containing protein [Helicobacter didelphidarum]RDU65265.1 hypothetical protein CQA53_06735 [Helicobacter didelphidarum]